MNHDRNNKPPESEIDATVSAKYRATATERTPPALDAAVLKKAEAAARKSGLQGFTAFWFRPLAFVASLGLALALVLELTSMETLQPAMDPNFEAGRQETESPRAVPSDNADKRTTDFYFKLDSPAGKQQSAESPASAQGIAPKVESGRRQRPEPAPALTNEIKTSAVSDSANAPVEDEQTSAEFADMIEASSKQMQQQDGVTEIAVQGVQPTRADEKEQVGEVAAFRASAFMLEEAARLCTEKQVSVPVTWWQCISDLEDAGRHDEAKAEMDLFNKAHPDFKTPEIIPSQ